MNIYLFDFDNTIVNLPYNETIEFLDQEESLDPNLNFTAIVKTRKDYIKYSNYDPDGLFLLLSNRISDVREPLINLLNHFGYSFDDCYLIEGEDRNKGNRVKKILKKYPGCKSITYWEDKDKHINSVTETLKEYPDIKLVVVKTTLTK